MGCLEIVILKLTFKHLGFLHFLLEMLKLGWLFHIDSALNLLEILHVDGLLFVLPLASEDLVG